MAASRSPLFALAAIALLVGGGVLVAQQHREATTAERTTGTVQHSEVDTYRNLRPSLFDQTEYRPNVTYSYTVDGTRYDGSRIFLREGILIDEQRAANAVVSTFPEGNRATVFYDPSNPRRSFLLPRYSFVPSYLAVVVGLLLGADYLTPGTRWLDRVASVFGADSRARQPTNEWDDPERLTETEGGSDGGGGGIDEAVVSGRTAWAVWAVAGVAALAVVGHYFLVSIAPYSVAAYATLVVVLVGAGAAVVRRRL